MLWGQETVSNCFCFENIGALFFFFFSAFQSARVLPPSFSTPGSSVLELPPNIISWCFLVRVISKYNIVIMIRFVKNIRITYAHEVYNYPSLHKDCIMITFYSANALPTITVLFVEPMDPHIIIHTLKSLQGYPSLTLYWLSLILDWKD